MEAALGSKKSTATPADISGKDQSVLIKSWFTVGCISFAFMFYVIFNWVTAPYFGPTVLPPGVEVPLQFKIGGHAVEVIMSLVWLYFIYTQIVKPIRESGQPNTLGLCGVGFFFAIFWDPSMNFIQQGCVYNPYLFNLGFLSAEIPGWMSPNANRLPEPLLAWAGGYPGFLIWGCLFGLACMRWAKAKAPGINNVKLAVVGVFGTMVFDTVLEILLIRVTGIYAYPGSIRAMSLWGGHWYQFPLYEGLLFGGWWGLVTVLLYFKDDKGLTWVERGVEKIDLCKRSNFFKGMMRAVAVVGFCQLVEILIYVFPMSIITMNADPFPDDTPAYFTVGTGMCGPGTGQACPRPDLPIQRRIDKEKFKDSPRINHEEAMQRVADNYGKK